MARTIRHGQCPGSDISPVLCSHMTGYSTEAGRSGASVIASLEVGRPAPPTDRSPRSRPTAQPLGNRLHRTMQLLDDCRLKSPDQATPTTISITLCLPWPWV